MVRGMAASWAPFSCASDALRLAFADGSFFLLRAVLAALVAVEVLDVDPRAAFFKESRSHSAPLRGAAARLLCHSDEPESPAISSRLRSVRTDSATFSALNPGWANSSRFLMRSHSVPLDPGRRDRIS